MERILTVQVGKYANWVGSHYWSANEYASTPTSRTYQIEDDGGYEPRLFLVDAPDNIGPVDVGHTEPQPVSSDTNVHLIHQSQPTELHHLRQAVLQMTPITPSILAQQPFTYWTDFWERRSLPRHRHILSASESPNEVHYKYWFEYKPPTADMWDETDMRKLIEETDSNVSLLQSLAGIDTSMVAQSVSLSSYLCGAYPKSPLLTLTSPLGFLSTPASDESGLSSPIPMVNSAYVVWSLTSLSEEVRESLLVIPPESDNDLLTSSARDAVWLDSISTTKFRNTENQPTGLTIESPSLIFDSQQQYHYRHPATTAPMDMGTIPVFPRPATYVPNAANPLSITDITTVSAGTFPTASIVPTLSTMIKHVRRFERHHAAAWEVYNDIVEKDDWTEIVETIQNVVTLHTTEVDDED